jgi:hypothetical protein
MTDELRVPQTVRKRNGHRDSFAHAFDPSSPTLRL